MYSNPTLRNLLKTHAVLWKCDAFFIFSFSNSIKTQCVDWNSLSNCSRGLMQAGLRVELYSILNFTLGGVRCQIGTVRGTANLRRNGGYSGSTRIWITCTCPCIPSIRIDPIEHNRISWEEQCMPGISKILRISSTTSWKNGTLFTAISEQKTNSILYLTAAWHVTDFRVHFFL